MTNYVCDNCDQGRVMIGEHTVTRDMAIDAGDRSLEGSHYCYEYEECQCCNGHWQDCKDCREAIDG